MSVERLKPSHFLKWDGPHGVFAVLAVPLFGHMLRLAALVLLISHSLPNNVSLNCVIGTSIHITTFIGLLMKIRKNRCQQSYFSLNMHKIFLSARASPQTPVGKLTALRYP